MNATPIAIVGMGCRFAGAPDLQSYWKLMLEGRDAFTEPPIDRWDTAVFHDTSKRATDKSYAPTGGFIDDIRSFPALAFGLPPRRVEVMDPQQRFTIEVSRQAIEDAGYNPDHMPYRTGTFVGMTASEYRTLMASRMIAQYMATGAFGSQPEDMTSIIEAVERIVPSRPFTAPGALANMAAAAVAQELDLHGPAYTTDAACASAMMAIADAVAQLRAGSIDAAVAGGAYICITPEHHIAFSRIGAMSAQGRCLPFDEKADGFVQGDGVAMIVLKRLDDALQDGDRVYAVLNGIAINNDGRGDGPMAPVAAGQTEVVRAAWRDAGLDMANVGYVECHGTGTDVGDIAEFNGLKDAFGDISEAWLGSAKANVGHTMAAAGVAGVIRAALSIYHRTIPPMAGFETPKADLHIDETNWHIPTKPVAWDATERVAGVSSFGFGGTNAHTVLSSVDLEEEVSEEPELILISGPNTSAVQQLAAATAEALRRDERLTVAGVARAWAVRMPQPQRLSIVAATRDELIAALDQAAAGERPDSGHIGEASDEPPKVAFLYPGQGSQRIGMLSGVRDRFPLVADTLGFLERELDGDLPLPLTHLLYPERRENSVDDDTASAELTDTANCQPALLACGIALTGLLEQVGVKPTVVVGHSLGEFTAAAVGGVLSAPDAASFVAARGRAMAELDGDHGAMAAVMDERAKVEKLLVDGAIIANVNHPRQLVVSGTTDAIAQVVANAEAAGIKAIALAVSHGFHSPVLAELDSDALLKDIKIHDPDITVASGIADHPYRNASEARDVFVRHATSPVLFTDALQQCVDAGADLFLQVGAGGPLAAFARGCLRGTDHKGIFSLAGTIDDDFGRSLLEALGRLWVAGVPVDVLPITDRTLVASVPPTVYDRQEYWAVKNETQLALNLKGYVPRLRETPQSTSNVPATDELLAKVAATADTVSDKVLAVVAKVSAYPLSALKASMTLVDDLGFDSLMVNDLATALADTFPQMDGIPQELFINRPTVQDLIDHVETSSTGGTAKVTDDDPLTSYAPTWLASALPAFRQRRVKTNTRALVVGSSPLADALGGALNALGCRVTRATVAEAASADATQAVFWFPELDAAPTIDAVLAGEADWPDAAAPLIAALDHQASLKATPDLITVFAPSVWAGGVSGVARSVAREWPDAVSKAIELHIDEPGAVVERVVAEWLSPDRTVDIRLTPAERRILGFDEASAESSPPIGSEDVVLVTGGTRGIGAKLGAKLAERGARILLLGRGAPSDEAQQLIDGSEGRVSALAADVTDRAALAAALDGTGVTALVHSAGVLADGALGSVPADKGQLARAVKVGGWLNALSACGPTLRVALGIGSWAGRFGNRHQAHYGAANAQLASIAEAGTPSCRLVVGEFGPWTSSDMVQTIPGAMLATMRKEGVDLVGDEPGLTALTDLLDGYSGAAVQGRELPWTTREVHLEHTLSTETDPYLLDHAIEGTPVLPLAAAADLLTFVAAPGMPFELSDLRLFRGITVEEPVDITLVARADRAEIRIGDRNTLAYRARVRPFTGDIEDPGPTATGKAPELTLDRFYGDITFHGPLLQGITAIEAAGEGFIRGRIRTGRPGDWTPGTNRSRFDIDPLALDSAMQLSAIVAFTKLGRAGTPIGMGSYVQLAPLPEGELIAEVTFGELTDDTDRFSGTIALRDTDGKLLVLATDVAAEMRKVDTADGLEGFEMKPEYTDVNAWPEAKDLNMRLDGAEMMGIRNPYFSVHEGTARNTTVVAGQELVNYSSYNYLGLSGDERVLDEVKEAIDRYGTSVSASRVASGERPFHGELEKLLAKCQGTDDAVVFTAGHATNVTTIGHVMKPDDLVMHDELIHDSALQGIKLSGASRRAFKHDDPKDLERQLRELRGHYKKVLIVVEGVYSMDGDICNLPAYIEVKKKYGCLLMVDEAHSFGIVGKTGQGVREHFDIDGHEVDLWMGTLSKSLASCGGWIAGSHEMIRYLKYTAPGFVYSAGITAANGVAGLASLELMLEEPWRVEKLQKNAIVFQNALTERGLDTGPARGESAVVPVVTGNSMHALLLSQRLIDQGVNVQPIVYPAVADDAARLRFFLSSTHTEEQLVWTAERVAETLADVRSEFPAPS